MEFPIWWVKKTNFVEGVNGILGDVKFKIRYPKIFEKLFFVSFLLHLKFIYSEKATKFRDIFLLLLTTVHTYSQQ